MCPGCLFYSWKSFVLLHIKFSIHLFYLLLWGSSQNLYYLFQLIHLRISHERRTSIYHLNQDTASWPHIYLSCVVCCSKNEFRGSVASRTYVCKVSLCWIAEFLLGTSCLADPKSVMMSLCLTRSTRIFCGFISLCAIDSMLR